MQIQFLGAADAVTGSRHLVTLGDQRILLDCGLFQGFKVLRERNWAPLGVPPHTLDAVVLSHAHLDHSGWLPGLVKAGFRGPIYASPATCDLASVLLLDSAHLQEEDARRANRQGFSRHAKALPLYTRADARRAIAQLVPLAPGKWRGVGAAHVLLTPVGHLLGACAVTLRHGDQVLGFSGDLGRSGDILMPAPQVLGGLEGRLDVLLVESTYGNRRHPEASDAPQQLAQAVQDALAHGGSLLLPTFAVGRAQALLALLQRLKRAGEIPADLPVFLDSPMAIEATGLYSRHRRLLALPQREVAQLCDGVRLVATAAQSQRLAALRKPAVILAASGMATGGRVLNHLKAMLPDPRHVVAFPGFQVGGSRGALLANGVPEVKIHGAYVPVRAAIRRIDGLSGHADADGLLDWLRRLPAAPAMTWVVHGEPDAADTLRRRIQDELGWRVQVPQHLQTVTA